MCLPWALHRTNGSWGYAMSSLNHGRQINHSHTHTHTHTHRVVNFGLLWPCIMNVGWRERNQQDATYLVFIIKLLSQHVSGIIMPIFRRTRLCTTCTHPTHHLHTPPLAAPNNTYTTRLSSSRRNTCITTPTPNTPDLTDIRIRYQLNTTGIHIYTGNPDYVYNSLPHTKSLWLSHRTVFSPSCYSAEHHMQLYTVLFSWWRA